MCLFIGLCLQFFKFATDSIIGNRFLDVQFLYEVFTLLICLCLILPLRYCFRVILEGIEKRPLTTALGSKSDMSTSRFGIRSIPRAERDVNSAGDLPNCSRLVMEQIERQAGSELVRSNHPGRLELRPTSRAYFGMKSADDPHRCSRPFMDQIEEEEVVAETDRNLAMDPATGSARAKFRSFQNPSTTTPYTTENPIAKDYGYGDDGNCEEQERIQQPKSGPHKYVPPICKAPTSLNNPPIDEQPEGDDGEDKEEENDEEKKDTSCIVDCLYVSLQCCECTVM